MLYNSIADAEAAEIAKAKAAERRQRSHHTARRSDRTAPPLWRYKFFVGKL